MRLTRSCFPEPSQIHLHGQVGPRCTTELVGHLVGFTVTLGGFKVDGEGEDRWNIQNGELDYEATHKKFLLVRSEGTRQVKIN